MMKSRRQLEKPGEASALGGIFGPRGVLRDALPDFEYRPAQWQMAEAVDRAISGGETLLAEAGTGTGKTLAYLIPALLHGAKTVVATGTKTLQEQLFFKDIPLLASALPRRFTVSLMKGRANYLCRRNLRRALAETHTRTERQALLKIQTWSAASPRGDRAELEFLSESDALWDDIAAWSETCLGGACEDFDECFLTRMRQEAAAADLVIVNHHLLLADAVLRDSSLFQVIPSHDVLILDEAHLLEDVATDFFGVETSNLRVERLVRDTHREWLTAALGDRSIPSHLSRLAESCARFFGALEFPEGARRLRPGALDGPCGNAAAQLVEALILLHDLVHAVKDKPEGLVACARRARDQAEILQGFLHQTSSAQDGGGETAVVHWAERRGRGLFLRTSPLDVSADFRRTILESARTVILTSATLSAAGCFDFLRNRLGVEGAREFRAPSPFDYASQAILYVPRHLPDPRSPGFLRAAAEEIHAILEITRGRALVLFTSLDAMETTHRLLEGRLPFPLMVQGEAPRTQLLDRFREEVSSVLLATRSFWQGVDVVGEALSCVIVHKLPFGFPGEPVLEARLEHIQHQGGDPFWDYQVPSAIITLRQGLGRLIRSGQDRGALCILDSRLLSRGYGKAFLASLPECPVTTGREELGHFFGTG
ncbi:MAG TPA: ATP-dependent DNA helicase [Candidatus Methylomirabilis sp.]|nr:ATP-dependent DNA helicase [Candidatus Methylomirabilis sp.]